MLDAFWTAVGFLMVGLVLVFVEILIPGFFIAVPGGALAFMGAIGLMEPDLMFTSAWAWVLWPVAAAGSAGVNLWFYKRWAPAGHAPITLSIDSLPGHEALVTVAVQAEGLSGKVRIRGQEWSARSEQGPIPAGAKVRVVRAEGVHVVVERA
ncbi:MAG: NfeD family protein [Thermoplasmatota archaeon]